jgi:polyphosphate kinase
VPRPAEHPIPVEAGTSADLRQEPDRFFNRELSWLQFNARVLALASDDRVPLLERAKFLAIFSSNLDEFFQVRVAGLKDQLYAGISRRSHDGRSPAEQLSSIREDVIELSRQHQRAFAAVLVPGLRQEGILLTRPVELGAEERKALDRIFDEHVFPVLTPLAVDPGHPFPYISNLSLNLAVLIADPEGGEQRFARVKVPSNLDRFLRVPGTRCLVALEELIASRLGELFPSMDVIEWSAFRVTRNADLTVEDNEADDLLEAVEMELRRRRFGRAVRVEVSNDMGPGLRDLLLRELDLTPDDLYPADAPLDLTALWSIHALDRPDLKDRHWHGTAPWHAAGGREVPADLFSEIRRGDVLVHHPYTSFHDTVEAFLRQASRDPGVVAIKMTLYRTSGESSIIRSLVRAAESGKQVAVLVELKARFDEARNIEWARALEEVGVHVVYGIVGLKTHTKTLLVVREEADGLRRYCHVGTGNYNPSTATIYEDLGLFTTDPAIGTDLSQLFNYLTGFSSAVEYEKLVVAPDHLRRRFEELIAGEADHGSSGRIVAKMNSLSDPAMIDAFYDAGRAGVEIDLVVRGICCLRPGVPGLSENIRVRSIVGRYLEHSRIYRFANGAGTGRPLHLIGSADLMTRNISRRVEALAPVEARALQSRLDEILEINLADDQLAWSLGAEGRWTRVPGSSDGGVDTHLALQAAASARSRPGQLTEGPPAAFTRR